MDEEKVKITQAAPNKSRHRRGKLVLSVVLAAALLIGGTAWYLTHQDPKFIETTKDDWRGVWVAEGTGYGVVCYGDSVMLCSQTFNTKGLPYPDGIESMPVLVNNRDHSGEPYFFMSNGKSDSQMIYVTDVADDVITTMSLGNLFNEELSYLKQDREELIFHKLYDIPETGYRDDLSYTSFESEINKDATDLLKEVLDESGMGFNTSFDPYFRETNIISSKLPVQIVGSRDVEIWLDGYGHLDPNVQFEFAYGIKGLRPVDVSFRLPDGNEVVLYDKGEAVR